MDRYTHPLEQARRRLRQRLVKEVLVMRYLDMWKACEFCKWARRIRYADGHSSIACTHPDNDANSTRDIVILRRCPEGREPHQ